MPWAMRHRVSSRPDTFPLPPSAKAPYLRRLAVRPKGGAMRSASLRPYAIAFGVLLIILGFKLRGKKGGHGTPASTPA